jgi:hypothetical protein
MSGTIIIPEAYGTPTVTVVTPYNQCHFIRDAIESALSEDYSCLE